MLELNKRGETFRDYGTHLAHVFTKTNLSVIEKEWDETKHYLWDILYSNLFTGKTQPVDSFFYRWEDKDLVIKDLLKATIANSDATAFTSTAERFLNKIIKKGREIIPAQGSSV